MKQDIPGTWESNIGLRESWALVSCPDDDDEMKGMVKAIEIPLGKISLGRILERMNRAMSGEDPEQEKGPDKEGKPN